LGDSFLRAIDLAIKAGALQKDRRSFVLRISIALEGECNRSDKPIRHQQRTGSKMFPADEAVWQYACPGPASASSANTGSGDSRCRSC